LYWHTWALLQQKIIVDGEENSYIFLPMIPITGNTYPVKDKLREMGGKWDSDQKAWMVPDDRAEEARQLVANAPKTTFRPHRCKMCGCAASRYNPIYRSGVCRNCWQAEKEEADMGY
jgi:hypothetical protein